MIYKNIKLELEYQHYITVNCRSITYYIVKAYVKNNDDEFVFFDEYKSNTIYSSLEAALEDLRLFGWIDENEKWKLSKQEKSLYEKVSDELVY